MAINKEPECRERALGLIQIAILRVIDCNSAQAYGSAITDQVAQAVGRELADGQVYLALQRLERHGLVSSQIVPMPSSSRGRPRKYYALTAMGRRALESAAYILSNGPFMQSTKRADYEGAHQGPIPAAGLV
jgi:PadR family transcriptional regulator, regulatory protein PadR